MRQILLTPTKGGKLWRATIERPRQKKVEGTMCMPLYSELCFTTKTFFLIFSYFLPVLNAHEIQLYKTLMKFEKCALIFF